MSLDKATIGRMRRFSQAFKDAHDRGANESDTVMYLVKFMEEVMGFDSLAGEITKEVSIKDRYCDIGIKLNGELQYLIEVKAASNKALREKDIEQAENYASRHGMPWVLLTNGVEWQLYHLSFSEGEGEGITHDVVFSLNFVEQMESDPDKVWTLLQMLSKKGMEDELLEDFWGQKKVLTPNSLVRVLFSETVLTVIRRELNHNAESRLDMADVFDGVKDVLSKDALLAAGDIVMSKKRKKRRKTHSEEDATPVPCPAPLAATSPPIAQEAQPDTPK